MFLQAQPEVLNEFHIQESVGICGGLIHLVHVFDLSCRGLIYQAHLFELMKI